MPLATPPPIALTSLKIRDFRGIERLDLDFRGPDGLPNNLAVLAGPNGSGKTAVLEAALIAVGGNKLAVGPRGKRAIRKGADDFEIRAEFRSSGRIPDTDEIVVNSTSSLPPKTDSRLPFWYFSSWRTPTLVGAVDVTVGKPGRRPAKTDPNRLLNVKQQLANAAAAQSFPGTRQHPRRDYSSWIASINEAWKTFYPDQDDRFAVGAPRAGSRHAPAPPASDRGRLPARGPPRTQRSDARALCAPREGRRFDDAGPHSRGDGRRHGARRTNDPRTVAL